MVLEVVSAIGDTKITSIGDENERRRFDMVEFGEQLRKAREEKGMTQQSLAEQLYVTRQSVSRWECGDRYPDLLTTKKISQILEVSLDDLLSGKEMKKVVERNPVIENKAANNIMIALYAFIVFSFVATIVDIVIRFPLQMEAIDYNDILVIAINVLSLI
ncbi:MAG: helix-turn-helix domain-containing protein, partial [Clostridium sp.]